MAKIVRNASTGQFTVKREGTRATIRDSRSGATLPLKGYGALKGEYAVKKGINLSKPIAAQAAKKLDTKRAVRAGGEPRAPR